MAQSKAAESGGARHGDESFLDCMGQRYEQVLQDYKTAVEAHREASGLVTFALLGMYRNRTRGRSMESLRHAEFQTREQMKKIEQEVGELLQSLLSHHLRPLKHARERDRLLS